MDILPIHTRTAALPDGQATLADPLDGGSARPAPLDVLASRIERATTAEGRLLLHRHGSGGLALVLLTQGCGTLHCGATTRPLAAPSLVLMPGDARAEMRADTVSEGFIVTLGERSAQLTRAREPAFGVLFHKVWTLPLKETASERRALTCTVCAVMRELRRSAPARFTALEAHLQLLLTGALRLIEQSRPEAAQAARDADHGTGRAAQLVAEFFNLTLAHSRERWRLRDYARALHVSVGYLRTACVRVTGASPVQLIHECLLREAQRLLLGTARPIGAIALELGFEDPAYFSRLFRVKTGFSPKHYRLSFGQEPAAATAQ